MFTVIDRQLMSSPRETARSRRQRLVAAPARGGRGLRRRRGRDTTVRMVTMLQIETNSILEVCIQPCSNDMMRAGGGPAPPRAA